MGDSVVLNIEAEIQRIDDSYEQDESCFKLSEVLFNELYKISTRPRANKGQKLIESEHSIQKPYEQFAVETPIAIEDESTFQKAQLFCIEYEEFLEFLPLCQIANFLNPFHKYCRQVYTDYCKCSIEVRNKILEINDCKLLTFSDKDWIGKSVNLFDQVIHERKLCTASFLYDGAKYFHRAIERYAEQHVKYDPWIFEPLIKSESHIIESDLKCNLHRYISDCIELLNDNPEMANVPPLDAIWAYCSDGKTPESEVTFWVCMLLIATCPQLESKSTDENDLCYVDLGDSIWMIDTQEDMYLYALLELYKFYYSMNGDMNH